MGHLVQVRVVQVCRWKALVPALGRDEAQALSISQREPEAGPTP